MKLKQGELVRRTGRQVLTGHGKQKKQKLPSAAWCVSTVHHQDFKHLFFCRKTGASCCCVYPLLPSKPLSLDELK